MTDETNERPTLVLMAQVERVHGIARVCARVYYLSDTGELRSSSWQSDPTWDSTGLTFGAYLGSDAKDEPFRGVWGWHHRYEDRSVETQREAQAIARVLGRVERGLDKANERDGWTECFAQHLLRIARIMRCDAVWVRNPEPRHELTAQRYRVVSGADLQHWVAAVDRAARESRLSEYVR